MKVYRTDLQLLDSHHAGQTSHQSQAIPVSDTPTKDHRTQLRGTLNTEHLSEETKGPTEPLEQDPSGDKSQLLLWMTLNKVLIQRKH